MNKPFQEETDKHWQSQYEGNDGLLMTGRREYEEAKLAVGGGFDAGKMHVFCPIAMKRISTLVSATHYFGVQTVLGKPWKLLSYYEARKELLEVIKHFSSFIWYKRFLTYQEQEVLIAAYMLLGINEDEVIGVGRYILRQHDVPLYTQLLVRARLSRIRSLNIAERKSYRWFVEQHCQEKSTLKMLEPGCYRTVNRLGRLVGNIQIVYSSARKADSKDVFLKSFGWIIAHVLTFGRV